MKNLYILIFLLSGTVFTFAQNIDSISLEKCLELSIEKMNIHKTADNNDKEIELRKQNLSTNYLPSLELKGQATYQSEALYIDLPIPGADAIEMPLDQYKAYLQINQLIYDGGITKSYKQMLDISIQENNLNTQIRILDIQKSVSNIFFMTILLDKQEKILANQLKTLNEQFKIIESSVKNQVLPPVHRDIMESEILKIEQKADEITVLKNSSLKILSEYTTLDLSSSKIIIPDIEITLQDTVSSPNIELLDLQSQKINLLDKQLTAQRMPKAFAFAQAGYGRPGLNMINTDFAPYFIGGVTLSWTIYDWNKTKRNRQIYDLKNESLSYQKQNIQLAVDVKKSNIIAKINSTEQAIEKDKKIIKLMTRILKTYDSQLKNGIITSSEYIIKLNKLSQAELNLELHKIQLEQLKFNYNNIY
ncbi:MAG: TolC family protein [Bacteroidota bacterium]|nr:TolC family protein [Bacteroidota bacterium]